MTRPTWFGPRKAMGRIGATGSQQCATRSDSHNCDADPDSHGPALSTPHQTLSYLRASGPATADAWAWSNNFTASAP